MQNEEQIWNYIEQKKEKFITLSDQIFDTPETLYKEFASVAEHTRALHQEGFSVSEGICGMPTAVTGDFGDEGPLIAILGEFDALPGLSQKPGVSEYTPIESGGHGHGCGQVWVQGAHGAGPGPHPPEVVHFANRAAKGHDWVRKQLDT